MYGNMNVNLFFMIICVCVTCCNATNITFPATAFSPFGGLPFEFALDFSNIFQGSNYDKGGASYLVKEFVEGLESFLGNLSPSDIGKEVTIPEKVKVGIETVIESRKEDLNFTTNVFLENLTVAIMDISEVEQDPCTTQKLIVVKNISKVVVVAKSNGEDDEELERTYNFTQDDVKMAVEQVLNSPSIQLIIRNQVFPACGNSSTYADPGEYSESHINEGARAIGFTLLALIIATIIYAISCAGCFMGCCCMPNVKETPEETEFLDKFDSLVKTPIIPAFMRYSFFLVVAANAGFFLSANVSVGATINLDFVVAGEYIPLPSIYDFSMLMSTIEMMKAGVILMGIVLMGFSIFWPYVKLIILVCVWVLPSSKLRPSRRACLLMWVDALGKWSMFDVFCLCVMMVVFNVEIVSPEWFVFPLGYYGMTLSMTCVWGMYANLIAQIISQCLSIFAIKSHKKKYLKATTIGLDRLKLQMLL